MRYATTVGRGILIVALASIAACASPPKSTADLNNDAAVVNGWVTTGTFQ